MALQFLEKFGGAVSQVEKRLAAYIDNPTDDKSIHNVRTSIRRLEASFMLLPKDIRKNNKTKIENYKQFFKFNSEIRDLDVISEKLATVSDSGRSILESLGIERERKVTKALRLAQILKKQSGIKLSPDTQISSSKFESRFDKLAAKLDKRIRERLPIVLSSSRKKVELHELRKDYKKLRYILEILPENYRATYTKKLKITGKKVRSDKKKGMVNQLRKLQEILGSIHDSDITIEYIKNTRISSKDTERILNIERQSRNQLYKELLSLFD